MLGRAEVPIVNLVGPMIGSLANVQYDFNGEAKTNQQYTCVRVCVRVRVCACACARVWARACMCVCLCARALVWNV